MLRIISGAQTGVDRAALDVAMENNEQCGGWCPLGRKAEDGIIPDQYPVKELQGKGYRQRTRKNVQASDGTVIIYFGTLRGGTEQTLRFCMDEHKPYLLIDGQEIKPGRAAERIHAFLAGLDGDTLNFAGPRASSNGKAYEYTQLVVRRFILLYRESGLRDNKS